jgi:hypothetical protein
MRPAGPAPIIPTWVRMSGFRRIVRCRYKLEIHGGKGTMTGNPCTMGHAQSAQVVKKAAVAKLCKPKD